MKMDYSELQQNGYTTFLQNINDALLPDCLKKTTHNAKIGHGVLNEKIRKDRTAWLSIDDSSSIKEYFINAQEIMKNLNERFYLGLKDFEAHFSIFEPGSYYRKHVDNVGNTNRRVITYITYLNENWTKEDGGLLKLENGELIIPEYGQSILFDSHDIAHEVLESHKKRYAISGWFIR